MKHKKVTSFTVNNHTSDACTMKSAMPADKHRRPQASNAYNVFFTLERLRLIDTTTDASTCDSETNQLQESYDLDGYESLALPDLPPRYQHLQLPMGWFVPGKNSKRKKRTKSKNDSTLPLLKQTRIIAENYKTIDKETKEYCVTVAGMIKQRHSLLITNEMLLQEAQECQPKKKKNPLGKLVQREVSSKKPRAVTDKKSGDTMIEIAPSTPIMWVDQSTVTSNLLTLSSKLLTLSKAYIDTLHCSTSPDDPKKEMWNHVPDNNTFLPFVKNQVRQHSVDYLNSQSTDNHRTHEMDDLFNYDSNRMITEYGLNFQPSDEYLGLTGYFLAGHDTDSNVRDSIVDEMLPEIANVNQRSTIAANMMRTNIMALTCEEEEESSPVNNDMFPATPFHLPYCQPVQNEGGEGMVLWHQVIESSHHQSLSSAKDEGVSNAYKTEEFPIDDSLSLLLEDITVNILGEDDQFQF